MMERYTLIQRLRHNVIKTGLRKINVAYSRISLADVCKKLHLDAGVEVFIHSFYLYYLFLLLLGC